MKIFLFLGMTTMLIGCSSHYANDARNKEIADAMREGRNPFPTSTLIAYHIQHGVQLDDSVYINSDDLNYVGAMATCQKVSIKENPYTYRAKAKIDHDDMTVKIEINRSNCQIDKMAVKKYLDDAIKANQHRYAERAEREKRAREVDPKGPYKLGCIAYQQHVKGISGVNSVENVIKQYPKLNAIYVKNLFTTGWSDASVYGVRGVDCEYLSSVIRG